VHVPHRQRDSRVGEAAQQPRRCVVARRAAQRLDEQNLDEARQHEATARASLARLVCHEAHERRLPLRAAHVHERG